MEKIKYAEMINNLNIINNEIPLDKSKIFLFGHCNVSLEIIDYLLEMGISVFGILDNNYDKQGKTYKGINVYSPDGITELIDENGKDNAIVLIASRFYSAMLNQLRKIGYYGLVRKVIDYNSYSDYDLSEFTIEKMKKRESHGEELLRELDAKYPGYFKVFCPFNALGDIYFMISYWPEFAQMRDISKREDNPQIEKAVFVIPDKSLAEVIHMFGDYSTQAYVQDELDSMIQAVLYTRDNNSFVAHQDRPYVIDLAKALYVKRIPLEEIYCCGVFGLPKGTIPQKPVTDLPIYNDIGKIPKGRGVIFSPYAKSVIGIEEKLWIEAVEYFNSNGYKCFTNVVGDEKALNGTEPISPSILEMKSVVEHAGTFIGIRSGLCDVIREAHAKKVALYPDYYYSDTKWKAIDMYWINEFEYNILTTEEIEWEKL